MDAVILHGVKTHNLKNFDLVLPHHRLYVISGVSGSGKSSLAFDTLYAEGQRRYVESLSAYARQFLERMEKPDVESVSGMPPAIAIEAKNIITNARSTVGTQTEINDYLRLLFSRIGRVICPDCSAEVTPQPPKEAAEFLIRCHNGAEAWIVFQIPLGSRGKQYLKQFLPELARQGFTQFFLDGGLIQAEELAEKKTGDFIQVCADRLVLHEKNRKRLIDSLELASRYGRGEIRAVIGQQTFHFSEALRCRSCGRAFKEPVPNLFSFNSPLGACPECQGFGRVITLDQNLIIPDENKSLKEGAVEPWTKPSAAREFKQLLGFARRKRIPVEKPWRKLAEPHRQWILEGVKGDPYFSVRHFFHYLQKKTYKMHVRIFLSKYRGFAVCPVCSEARLKPEGLMVRMGGKNIYELQCMSIDRFHGFLESLAFTEAEGARIEPVFVEIKKRVRFLKDVGLGYLSLSRLSRTLSGGEVQRIHLATSLGSALVDTLYVLDEPSVGLHDRDNRLLLRLLAELRNLGNTVVIVEHDRTMIEAADEIIDLGPGGGKNGGSILFQGKIKGLYDCRQSLTGQYLSGARTIERRHAVRQKTAAWIRVDGASEHNLKHIRVEIPLEQLVVITGVSGSGKSTLLYDILYRHYLRYKGMPVQDLGRVDSISGFENIQKMVLVDQSPIGRTPRSNPVTYIKAFDEIRRLFARIPAARRQGWGPGHFSFNVDGGRCEACKGDGRIKVEMHFLADIFVTCEACQGKRFKGEILEIHCREKNIHDVLSMTVEEALKFFEGERALVEKLSLLNRVGLGYLQLGQSATTLSGGEAQRLKLASEMIAAPAGRTLYLFDEPTTGLHYHEIRYLMEAFDELLARGHSLIVIEHNMEVIRSSDYAIDLGPEGGEGGGEVVYQGPLQGLMGARNSYTGKYLKEYARKPEKSESMSI